jgi:hypothetical protein
MLRVIGAVVKDGSYETVSVDQNVLKTVEKAKLIKKKGFDNVTIVSGLPGMGKSSFAIGTWAPLITTKGNKIYIEFTARNFINRCANPDTKTGDTVISDESFEGMNTGQAQRAEFQEMMNMLMLVRQKQLNIVIVIQDFFSLAKTIAIFRANILFHVITNKKGEQGYALCFSRKKKKMLYILGKKFINYGATKANYTACFRKNDPNMPEDYIERKHQHLIQQNKELRTTGNIKRMDIAKKLMDNTILNLTKRNFRQKDIAQTMGIGLRTVTEHWQKMKMRGIVPELYLDLNKLRGQPLILPSNMPTVPLDSGKAGAHSIFNNPDNTRTGAILPNGEDIAPLNQTEPIKSTQEVK